MTPKQLESLVNGIQKPNLMESEVRLLLNKEDAYIKPIPKPHTVEQPMPQKVAQNNSKPVAQRVAQKVAQEKSKSVAQEVAQVSWVAQVVPQKVAQTKSKVVAQDRPQMVAQSKLKVVAQSKSKVAQNGRIKDKNELLIEKYVNELKAQISKIQGVDERKRFIRDVGWGVMTEKRGRKYYLFGAKKLGGRKYKLYVGNATN